MSTTMTRRTAVRAALALGVCAAIILAPAVVHAAPGRIARSAALLSIHMNNATSGWAIDRSAIVRTTNGGVAWSEVTPRGISLQNDTVTATYFPAPLVAWVALAQQGSPNAIIAHTNDGGRTWQRTSVTLAQAGGTISEIQFLSGQRVGWLFAGLGAAAGSSGAQIFRTTDGGAHWAAVSTTDPPNNSTPGALPLGGIKSGVGFRTALDGFATGVIYGPPGFSYLYRTADGGHTWRHQNLPLPAAYQKDNPSLTPPVFFSARDGILPVGLAAAGLAQLLYVTHDGGATWTPTTLLPNARGLEILTMQDAWAVESPQGNTKPQTPLHLYVTHDGGQHWTALAPRAAIHDGAVLDFIGSCTGFVLYPSQSYGNTPSALFKTTNGGRSWTTLHPYVTPGLPGTGIHPD